jgi:hypothetical protein
VQFNASCLAGCSESEIAEIIASIAEKFFIDNLQEFDRNDLGLPIIAAAPEMAAAV